MGCFRSKVSPPESHDSHTVPDTVDTATYIDSKLNRKMGCVHSKVSPPESRDSHTVPDTVDTATYIDISLTQEKKQKLNELLEEMHDKAAIDYTRQEIIDIESAVHEMLWRISERMNSRGVFKISRLQAYGSMAERASVWKHLKFKEGCDGLEDEDVFTAFDYLAVIGEFIDERIEICSECAEVSVSDPGKYISAGENLLAGSSDLKMRFYDEVLTSVDSLFYCLTRNNEDSTGERKIRFKHDSSVCEGCIVRTTGRLHVNTSIPIMPCPSWQTPANCSLIFQWESRSGTLHTPNITFAYTQQVKVLPIFIDFLPAFESRSSQMSHSGHVYKTFLIPKICNFCLSAGGYWRKSFCLSEIHTIANELTKTHQKCYRIIKLLLELMDYTIWYSSYINQYLVKTMVLHHTRLCPDTSDDCANCVLRILYEVELAYETKNFRSFHSNQEFQIHDQVGFVFRRFIDKLCSVSTDDSIDMFVRKIAAKYGE